LRQHRATAQETADLFAQLAGGGIAAGGVVAQRCQRDPIEVAVDARRS
jgi:hypothetical protein